MDVGVELAGLQSLEDRLAHAHDGVLQLDQVLTQQLQQATPPQLVYGSPTMRPRTWGAGDLWQLPAGGWVAPRVRLPNPDDILTQQLQQLLD